MGFGRLGGARSRRLLQEQEGHLKVAATIGTQGSYCFDAYTHEGEFHSETTEFARTARRVQTF
jgi:hypothetical protein